MPDIALHSNIKHSKFAATKVDIIVPFHGNYLLVRKLVESLLKQTLIPKFRLILVDDGSDNEAFGIAWNTYGKEQKAKRESITMDREQQRIVCIRLNEQRGFGGALKAGFEASNSPYVCFLNSDCIIKTSNWLMRMGETLLDARDLNVRMVSARSNNPVSDIAELGGKISDKVDDVIVSEHLPLYCALAHRALFDKIGGFIKSYPYGMYEDEELAHRMNRYGYKQAVCGSSWVYHEGEATLKQFINNPKISKIILKDNFERLKRDIG